MTTTPVTRYTVDLDLDLVTAARVPITRALPRTLVVIHDPCALPVFTSDLEVLR